MTRWTGVVLALPDAGAEEMASRLPAFLHPVAGRPLVWHTVHALGALPAPPARVLVVAGPELDPDLFQGLPVPVELVRMEDVEPVLLDRLGEEDPVLVADAAAFLPESDLLALLAGPPERWLGSDRSGAAAVCLPRLRVPELLRLNDPLSVPSGVLGAQAQLPGSGEAFLVRDRADLARVVQRVRDRLVGSLMRAGVTFLLPQSVLLDVDVRIGRDCVIYPGVVLEGQTNIGDETVIGPGCRLIDSWIGSGVELKGWNYVAHTSIRNRAILEPYVRRGFD
jgi:hypothetical protein